MELKNFLETCIAKISGDDAKAKSLKIQRKATAYIKSQISAKEARALDLETEVEEAQEEMAMIIINQGEAITDNKEYIRKLLVGKANVVEAQKVFEEHNKDVVFLEETLAFVKKGDFPKPEEKSK